MLEQIISNLFLLVITAAIIAAIKVLVPYVSIKIEEIKNKEIKDFIKKAISYVENQYDTLPGEEKFKEVVTMANNFATKLKLKTTDEFIKSLVEGIFAELDLAGLVNNK